MDAKLKPANYFRRFVAFIIDLALLIFCTVILYSSVTSTFLFDYLGGSKASQKMIEFTSQTNLFAIEYNEEGEPLSASYLSYAYNPQSTVSIDSSSQEVTIITQEDYGYKMYEKAIYDFWTGFYLEDDRLLPLTIDGEEVPKPSSLEDPLFKEYGKYLLEEFYGLPKLTESQLEQNWGEFSLTHENWEEELDEENGFYRYSLGEDGYIDFTLAPSLTSRAIEGLNGNSDSQWVSSLADFFNDGVGEGVYCALADWTIGSGSSPQTYYRNLYNEFNRYIYVAFAVAYAPFLLIFFYIIPVFMRDGRTLGKALTHLSVVSREGVRIKLWQRLTRPLMVFIFLSFAFLPSLAIGIMFIMLFALLDFMFMILHRSHKTFEDLATRTILIDARESLWFKNEEEAERYFASHPESKKKKEKTPEEIQLERELSILDSSTLFARKEEASKISSFDDFEAEMEEKHQARLEEILNKTSKKEEESEEKNGDIEEKPLTSNESDENPQKEMSSDEIMDNSFEDDSFLDEQNKDE